MKAINEEASSFPQETHQSNYSCTSSTHPRG